jgi:hypothetical protein
MFLADHQGKKIRPIKFLKNKFLKKKINRKKKNKEELYHHIVVQIHVTVVANMR